MPINDKRTGRLDALRADPGFDFTEIESDEAPDLEVRNPALFDETPNEPLADSEAIGQAIDVEKTVLRCHAAHVTQRRSNRRVGENFPTLTQRGETSRTVPHPDGTVSGSWYIFGTWPSI